MLHLWSKPVHMLVEPHQVTALMPIAGHGRDEMRDEMRNETRDEIVVAVAKPETGAGAYDGIGKALCDILPQINSSARHRQLHGSCRLDLEVADTLVHYDVLKLDARRLPPPELDHLAALALADTLCLDPASLVMRCSVQLDGLSAVVCGMPSALVDVIKLACDDNGCRLNSLQPGFAAFWNGTFAHSKNHNALLARLRGKSLMLGWLRDGKWQALAAERLSRSDWLALSESCEAFCRRLCVPDHAGLQIYFDADIGDIPPAAHSRWQRLPPQPETLSDAAAATTEASDIASNFA